VFSVVILDFKFIVSSEICSSISNWGKKIPASKTNDIKIKENIIIRKITFYFIFQIFYEKSFVLKLINPLVLYLIKRCDTENSIPDTKRGTTNKLQCIS
jgi:hypothetical protein